MVIHICNPSPWEAEASRSIASPSFHNEFQVSLGCRERQCLRKQTSKQKDSKTDTTSRKRHLGYFWLGQSVESGFERGSLYRIKEKPC